MTYACLNEGIPTPTVSWSYNGASVPLDSGVTVIGDVLAISEPQVSHSGVYQCVVSNMVGGLVREDRRDWVLEIREPSK